MDYLWHQMHRHLGKTNSLQIILAAIGIHSLISILMIYFHLTWYFSTESNYLLENDSLETKSGIALIESNKKLNLVSTKIIEPNEITHYGWWMDHARWKTDIQCFNKKWSICSKVFSTQCKSDNIRAIYYYIPIDHEISLKNIQISLRANAEQLLEQNGEAYYGMTILVKLSDGNTETLRIKFPSELEVWTQRKLKYSSKIGISSLTLMLTCIGYSGTVFFTDINIIPILGTNQEKSRDLSKITSWCSNSHKTPRQNSNLKYETLNMPNTNGYFKKSNITLVIQVSLDRLMILEHSLQTWRGPISLVIYVPVKDMKEGILDWQRNYIIKKLKSLNLTSNSDVSLVAGFGDNNYPINAMRNIAMSSVKTKFMFLTDADFQPSPELEQRFASHIIKKNYTSKDVFVVPAFEYLEMPKKGETVPKIKPEFLQLIHRQQPLVQPFRIFESAEAHQLTDYWKWFYANSPYQVHAFSDKYEPYIIAEKSEEFPKFDERFAGYGMNKVTHITELFAAKYNFNVINDIWMIHVPHKASSYSQEFLQHIEQRLKNRAERFEFISEIIETYKIKLDICSSSSKKKILEIF